MGVGWQNRCGPLYRQFDKHTYRQIQLDCIDRFVKRPSKVVSPQRLEKNFLQKLKLVCHPPLSTRVFHWGLRGTWVGHLIDRGHPRTLKAFI